MATVPFWLMTVLLVLGTVVWAAESQRPQSQQAESGKGLTVDDLVRGARGAAQNIEKEIPKIGPAVGKALKSISANSSEKTQTQPRTSDKK